jgi:hypothetical protein
MSRESTRKHRDYMNAKLAEREGKSVDELGRERLEIELDMLEQEGELLDNDAFDKALADGLIGADGSVDNSQLDLSQLDGTDHHHDEQIVELNEAERPKKRESSRLFFDTNVVSMDEVLDAVEKQWHEVND